MQTYLDQLQHILDNGVVRGDRTGVGTISTFGLNARYDLTRGFPAVTTKKLAWKVMSSELLWFISGSTNINDLKAIYEHNRIWDANYEDYVKRLGLEMSDGALHSGDSHTGDSHTGDSHTGDSHTGDSHTGDSHTGDMGRVYGSQWRRWRTTDGRELDQLQQAIDLIRENPESRRIIVNAWNPGEAEINQVALPPCHTFFQFYVANEDLSLHMYQRSADMFLGVPFNIASYSLLLHMVAKVTGLRAKEFVHTIGDAHIYLDAVDQVREQVSREPLAPPSLHIEERGQKSIDDFVMSDFKLVDYQCHEAITAKMAV